MSVLIVLKWQSVRLVELYLSQEFNRFNYLQTYES